MGVEEEEEEECSRQENTCVTSEVEVDCGWSVFVGLLCHRK